jgi:hypothetical protein
MKRLAAAFAAAAVLTLVVAGGSGANLGPPFDMVTGSGIFPYSLGDVPISVSARETASGPDGFFTVHEPDGNFGVEVGCLSVSGNMAVVGGEIVTGPALYIGAGYLLLIVDNGTTTPDTVQIARVPTPPDPSFQCDLGGGETSVGGNFTVHDAP